MGHKDSDMEAIGKQSQILYIVLYSPNVLS